MVARRDTGEATGERWPLSTEPVPEYLSRDRSQGPPQARIEIAGPEPKSDASGPVFHKPVCLGRSSHVW